MIRFIITIHTMGYQKLMKHRRIINLLPVEQNQNTQLEPQKIKKAPAEQK